jgi:aminopeptidase N
METTTGTDLSVFFNQWYYGKSYPVFNVIWNQRSDTLTIYSKQSTDSPANPLFKTHFDVKLKFLTSDSIVRLYQNINNQTFKITVKENVTTIEIDPNNWILKKVESITTGVNDIHENTHNSKLYPNPFKESSNLEFYLDKPQLVRIETYSINGSLIDVTTMNGTAGVNLTTIGGSLKKGIYFCRIEMNDTTETFKLIKL